MTRVLATILLAAGWLLPGAGMAQSPRALALAGTQPGRPACAACHLPDGAGQPDVGIPRLAGLSADYLADQLGYFAAGTRYSAAMSPYAAALTGAQQRAVAGWFAALPVPAPVDPLPVPDQVRARGEVLYASGDERGGVLACALCHGATGAGVGIFSPGLAGQSAAYVAVQLRLWRAGRVRDPKDVFMRAVSGHLSDADIAAVSGYIATMRTGEPARP